MKSNGELPVPCLSQGVAPMDDSAKATGTHPKAITPRATEGGTQETASDTDEKLSVTGREACQDADRPLGRGANQGSGAPRPDFIPEELLERMVGAYESRLGVYLTKNPEDRLRVAMREAFLLGCRELGLHRHLRGK